MHKALGPGLVESAYQRCLAHELEKQGIRFAREVPVPVKYGTVELATAYRVDFLIDGRFVLDLKSVERLTDAHIAQMLTYLRLLDLNHGLLMNFREKRLIDGLRSVVR